VFKQKLTYWFPRVFVVFFALSLILPAPKFIANMGLSQRILWWARLIWVIGLPSVFCLLCVVVALFKKRRAKKAN